MNKRLIIILILLGINIATFSQAKEERYNKEYNEAIALARRNDFNAAIRILKKINTKHPNKQDILFSLANCYMDSGNAPDSAITYYEKTLSLLSQDDYNTLFSAELHMSLAKSYQLVHKPERALDIYQKLESRITSPNAELSHELELEKGYCNNAIEFMQNPVKLELRNLQTPINSKYNDHSPLLSADESILIFTSRRPNNELIMDDGQYPERIYVSNFKNGKWSKPVSIKTLFKSSGHEAGVHLSSDGRYLFIYRVDIQGMNIYRSEYDGETWSKAERMPAPISSKYDETHLSLSPDGTTAYFTSNRPGGHGGFDIYRSRQLPDGTWGVPQNLGPEINSPEDEESPMIHPDGKTLYFSSRGHKSMGGFDVFYSKERIDSTWTEAVNLGYPINSGDDDLFFVPTAVKNRAYYASSRFNPKIGGIDIFEIEYEEPEEARLAVISGFIECETPIDNVSITVMNSEETLMGIYKPHPVTGKYIMILESNKSYTLKFKGEGIEDYEQDIFVDYDMAYSKKGKLMALSTTTLKTDEEYAQKLLAEKESKNISEDDGIPYYTVQIISSRSKVTTNAAWKNLDKEQVKEYIYTDGWYVYSYGSYKGYKAAVKAKQDIIKKTRYHDSFVRDPKQYEKYTKSTSDK